MLRRFAALWRRQNRPLAEAQSSPSVQGFGLLPAGCALFQYSPKSRSRYNRQDPHTSACDF